MGWPAGRRTLTRPARDWAPDRAQRAGRAGPGRAGEVLPAAAGLAALRFGQPVRDDQRAARLQQARRQDDRAARPQGARPATGPARSARCSSTPAVRVLPGQQFAAAAGFVLGAPLLRKFDVVGWDPRGVGRLDAGAVPRHRAAGQVHRRRRQPGRRGRDQRAEHRGQDAGRRLPAALRRAAAARLAPRTPPATSTYCGESSATLELNYLGYVVRHLARRDVRRAVPEERRPAGARRRGRPVEDVRGEQHRPGEGLRHRAGRVRRGLRAAVSAGWAARKAEVLGEGRQADHRQRRDAAAGRRQSARSRRRWSCSA